MNIPLIRKFLPKGTLNRYHIAGLITGVLLVAALILPSIAAGVSASLATSASSYVLGSTISMPASVNVGIGEFTKVSSATLTIAGPQPVTKALPTTPTSGQQDLGDNVKVAATLVNLLSADAFSPQAFQVSRITRICSRCMPHLNAPVPKVPRE